MNLRARDFVILAGVVAVEVAGDLGLRRGMGLGADLSAALVGLLIWSLATIIVAERYGDNRLTLMDYNCLHAMGLGALILGAMRTGELLNPRPSDPNLVLEFLAVLPAIAVDTITRHVLFTREERDAIRARRGRQQPKPIDGNI